MEILVTSMFLAAVLLSQVNEGSSGDVPGHPTLQEVKALSDNLMKNYSKHILPKERWGAFNITIWVNLVAVGEIDEVEEKLSTVMWVLYEWIDESIKWNISNSNVSLITLGWTDVWKPVLRVLNPHADSSNRQATDRTYDSVIYFSDGGAYFDEMMVSRTTCDLDLTFYPFDEHTCFVNMSIVGATKYLFNLSAEIYGSHSVANAQHGSWHLQDYKIHPHEGFLDIELNFERRPLFLVLNILLPIIVVAFLTPIVFVLPKKSGERVGFSITMLLALSVYMTIVSDHLPQNSEPMPIILIMIFIWYMIDAVIVLMVIINTKIFMYKDVKPLPVLARKFVHVTNVLFRQDRKAADTKAKKSEKQNPPKTNSTNTDEENPLKLSVPNTDDNDTPMDKLLETEQVESSDEDKTGVTWKEFSGCIDKWCFVLCYFIKVALPFTFFAIIKVKR